MLHTVAIYSYWCKITLIENVSSGPKPLAAMRARARRRVYEHSCIYVCLCRLFLSYNTVEVHPEKLSEGNARCCDFADSTSK